MFRYACIYIFIYIYYTYMIYVDKYSVRAAVAWKETLVGRHHNIMPKNLKICKEKHNSVVSIGARFICN